MECQCCKHQRVLSGWNGQWCEPQCILTRFRPKLWALWDLFGRVMVPVSIGFGAVMKIGIEEFKFWTNRAYISDDYIEEVYDQLQKFQTLYDDNKSGATFDEEDVKTLFSMTEEPGFVDG